MLLFFCAFGCQSVYSSYCHSSYERAGGVEYNIIDLCDSDIKSELERFDRYAHSRTDEDDRHHPHFCAVRKICAERDEGGNVAEQQTEEIIRSAAVYHRNEIRENREVERTAEHEAVERKAGAEYREFQQQCKVGGK